MISDPVINVEGFKFAIQINPSQECPNTKKWSMRIDIVRCDRLPECIRASYTVEVIGHGEKAVQSFSSSCVREFSHHAFWGFKRLEASKPLDYASLEESVAAFQPRLRGYTEAGWIVNDTFTVETTMKLFLGKAGPLGSISILRDDGCQGLASDLEELLKGSVAPDVTLVCKDGQCGAHGLILAMRSPVFRTMFQQGMQETQRGEVVLSDIDVASLRLFLNYIYCGILPDGVGEDGLWALIAVAHKYDVQKLLAECTLRWQSKLAPSNAAAVFQEADKLGIAGLKRAALVFITRDSPTFEQVQDSATFKLLPATLLQELLAHTMGLRKRKCASDQHEFPDDSVWETLPVTKLKQALSERSLPTTGQKAQLIARLREHVATIAE